jgi:two-component system cell cycle sensor histidine kinase/response regulator CckA
MGVGTTAVLAPAILLAIGALFVAVLSRRAAAAVKSSEVRYRRLFESAKDGILILDVRAGAILDVNRFLIQLLGDSKEELLGKHLWEIGVFKDIAASKAAFETLRLQEYIRYDNLPLITKDGRKVDVEFVSNVYGEGGEQVIQCNIRDITDRKRLEAQSQQAQKMEALGRLAGGVAHDFNNLLTAIIGYGELALIRLDKDDPIRDSLEEIKKAGNRAAALTKQLLAFSRHQVLQPRVLDLNGVVADVAQMLRRLIGEDIELVTVYKSGTGNVTADEGQIEQLIMNLVLNARDAIPNGGRISLEVSSADLGQEHAYEDIAVRPGRYVLLTVSDNGVGMDRETQSHIFEPFFTTKEQGKGTGLGLAMAYGLAKQTGGTIEVHSELGIGTTVKVFLPIADEGIKLERAAGPDEKMLRGTETVLLVEDEEIVRKMARTILEMNGYTVLEARDPDEAAHIAEVQTQSIELMLTDMVMPRMNGWELARRLSPLRPNMRVLFMSGYVAESLLGKLIVTSEIPFIMKPFTPAALAPKVRDVLDAKEVQPLPREVIVSD